MRKTLKNFANVLLLSSVFVVGGGANHLRAESPQGAKIAVTGVVSDAEGPVIGASVVEKGNPANGVTTDVNGKYTLQVSSNATLEFSYLGYTTQQVPVAGKTAINITLEEDSKTLDELVVIGYQSVQKRFASGSVSSVSADEIANLPAPSFSTLLAGKATGLTVKNLGGAPGSSGAIVIRGNSVVSGTLGEANQFSNPLYVIDGVPTTLEEIAGYGKTNNDYLASLNTDDIESLDILKDASAAAIYGSRGANGVIIIKTKAGSPGKMKVTLNAYGGLTNRPNLMTTPVGTAERRMKLDLIRDTWSYDAQKKSVPIMLTDSLNPAFNNNMDYQGLFYQQGIVQSYNASITGGTEQLNYRMGLGYYDERGIITQTGFDRYTMSLNVSQKPWDRVRNQTIVNGSYMSREPGASNANSRKNFPVAPVDMNSSLFYVTPEQLAFLTGSLNDYYNTDKTLNVQATNILNIDLYKGIAFNSQISGVYTGQKRNQFKPSTIDTDKQQYALYNYNQRIGINAEHYLSYTSDIAKNHNVNVILGTSFESNNLETIDLEAYGEGAGDMIKTVSGYKKADITGNSTISQNAMLRYFARLGYRFADKYQIDLNYSRDASSRFGKNKRWGDFPSLGVYWIFSEESFMDFTDDWLTFGKLKYSIGRNGKQFSDDYLRYNMYKLGYNSFLDRQGESMTSSSYNGITATLPDFSKLADNNLSWENTVQSDFGFELELFKNRLFFYADYYVKNTDALLFDVQFPDYTGFDKVKANIVGIRNSGYEFTLDAHLFPRKNDFTLEVQAGIAHNSNIITKLPNGNRDYINSSYGYGYVVGKPGPLPLGLIYEGPLQSLSDLPVNPFTGNPLNLSKGGVWGTVEPGYPQWKDVSGDYNVSDEADQDVVLADFDPQPKVMGHLNLVFGWKEWQLRVNTNYSFGQNVYDEVSQTLLDRYDRGSWVGKAAINYADYDFWSPTNQGAYYPSLLPSAEGEAKRYAFRNNQTMWWEDGSYWKINDITVSYTFKPAWLKQIKMDRLLVYVTAYNVGQWQASDKLLDASMVDSRGHVIGDGYPQPRKYTVGLNVQF
ncbi:SusC/RagA family TonB-linked outer membrane protein [Bacteroidia bacterium]|nr:SusC/RagA family TonB-linked outer membrane protein [Bacteroidia bacterium]